MRAVKPGVQVGLNLACGAVGGIILRDNGKIGELPLPWYSCFSLFTVIRFNKVAINTDLANTRSCLMCVCLKTPY